MRTFIKWLFKGEFEIEKQQYIAKSKKLLEDTERATKKEYVRFNPIPINSEAFIHGMQPFIKSESVLSWLQGYKDSHIKGITTSMLGGYDKKVLTGSAQLAMVEILLSDLEKFDQAYKLMIDSKKDKK